MTLFEFAAGVNLDALPKPGVSDNSMVVTIFNIFLAIAGATALLVITVSGLKFTLSNGDPQTIAKAKNSIIYAVAGLVIIVFAATLTNFVFNRI